MIPKAKRLPLMLMFILAVAAYAVAQDSSSSSGSPAGNDQPWPFSASGPKVNALGVTGGVVYMRSTVGPPWGVAENEQAMDAVFGAGNWQDLRYETANAAVVFSNANGLVFMEGGDFTANEMETFLNANIALIQAWVNAGGRLLLNSAPNEGDGMSYGFGGSTLNYFAPGFSPTAAASAGQSGHPIFSGPFSPAGTAYTGNFFAHGAVTCTSCTALITGNAPGTVLAEKFSGSGIVLFGSMTTTNFRSPQLNGRNLLRNILSYLGTVPLTTPCGQVEGKGNQTGRSFRFFISSYSPADEFLWFRRPANGINFVASSILSREFTSTRAVVTGWGYTNGILHSFVLDVQDLSGDGTLDTLSIKLDNGVKPAQTYSGGLIYGDIDIQQIGCNGPA